MHFPSNPIVVVEYMNPHPEFVVKILGFFEPDQAGNVAAMELLEKCVEHRHPDAGYRIATADEALGEFSTQITTAIAMAADQANDGQTSLDAVKLFQSLNHAMGIVSDWQEEWQPTFADVHQNYDDRQKLFKPDCLTIANRERLEFEAEKAVRSAGPAGNELTTVGAA